MLPWFVYALYHIPTVELFIEPLFNITGSPALTLKYGRMDGSTFLYG